MTEIVNKFLLSGNKFMPEMRLRQPGFTSSDCGPFTKNKERIKKFKETEDSRYIYQNELDNVCFQHDMGYGLYGYGLGVIDFKYLSWRTFADKELKRLVLLKIQSMIDIKQVVLQGFIKKVYYHGLLPLQVVVLKMNIFLIRN